MRAARLLVFLALVGCTTAHTGARTATVRIESTPPGAMATICENASCTEGKVLGPTPVNVERSYDFTWYERPTGWWVPYAGLVLVSAATTVWGAMKVADYQADVSSTTTTTTDSQPIGPVMGMTAGITGLTFGTLYWAMDGQLPTGEENGVASSSRPYQVKLEAAGYEPVMATGVVPGPTERTFMLTALAGTAPAVAALPPVRPAATTGEAVAGAPQLQSVAVSVGLERYRDLPAATGARRDAERFAALATRTLGIPEGQIRLLVDDRAAKTDLEGALEWAAATVKPGGRIYLFYAGHGAPDPATGAAYLVPFDADASRLAKTGLGLTTTLESLQAKAEVVAFIDACFSGSGGRSVLPKDARPLVPVKTAGLAPRAALLSASGAQEISGSAADGAGLFSSVLFEGLGRARADIDGDGVVTLDELATYITPRVERHARAAGRAQTPQLTLGDALKAPIPLAVGVIAH